MTEYAERDLSELDDYYYRHVNAMTGEKLHSKSAIAAELAWRDKRIAELEALLQRSRLQEEGVHPAPCAKHCEAAAFTSEIRRLRAENAELRAKVPRYIEAKRAVIDYEREYVGQDSAALWELCLADALRQRGDQQDGRG